MDSIRWEASREGLQDYEYFWMLANKTKQIKEQLGTGADFIDEKQRSDEICRFHIDKDTMYVRMEGTSERFYLHHEGYPVENPLGKIYELGVLSRHDHQVVRPVHGQPQLILDAHRDRRHHNTSQVGQP